MRVFFTISLCFLSLPFAPGREGRGGPGVAPRAAGSCAVSRLRAAPGQRSTPKNSGALAASAAVLAGQSASSRCPSIRPCARRALLAACAAGCSAGALAWSKIFTACSCKCCQKTDRLRCLRSYEGCGKFSPVSGYRNTPPAEFLACLRNRLHVLPGCAGYKCEPNVYPNVRVVTM